MSAAGPPRAGRPARGRSVLATIFAYEIRMLLRDTRTILITVVAPVVLFPAYVLLLRFVEDREQTALEEATYTYVVVGSEASWAAEVVEAAVALEAAAPDTTRARVRFEARSPRDPEAALAEGGVHLLVQGLSVAEWDSIRAAERAAGDSTGDEEPRPLVPAVRILFRADSDFSRAAEERLTERIIEVRDARRDRAYRGAGFPVAVEEVARVEAASVATAAREAGAFLGAALTPFLVLLMLTGGSIVAVDAISGEKERGTLETLLTTAAGRTDIVRAKLLAVVVVGLAVAMINIANLVLYLVVGLLELPENMVVDLGPVEILAVMVLLVPVTVLVAAALLLLSGASNSYKEYQINFFPVVLAFFLPSMAASLPGVELRSAIAFVPLAGVAVAVREVLVGEMDVIFVWVAFLSTGGLALWLTRLTESTLSNEKLIGSAELDAADLAGGGALFPRHVLRWFLGLWVIFFLASLWYGERLGLRGQALVNLLGIMLGGSLVMIRRYRLDAVEALGLRAPHPTAWIAVLVGAPSALILGIALSQLVNTYVFPVPEELLRSFAEQLSAPELPLWQLVMLVCVLPGICEELTFRGVLLHGLRQRIRSRWLLALAVGAVFGFFHVSLFRIIPTAWLGFVFTWVALLGGSIYPAMVWHALNNALSLLPSRLGLLPDDFVPDAWWAAPAALGLAFSMWILWWGGARWARPGSSSR